MIVAHASHWLISMSFAGPPALMVLALVGMSLRERRRSTAYND